ncbi:MAG: hypothetical protein CMJ25_17865 [Phycisphaerae bacterium]|nr:hypothetical protein [Phycisphaerae bacterium]|tara:strand:- start:238 stop:1536 length:1299 start_codon:yes stop_codon:yes gene_type:complete
MIVENRNYVRDALIDHLRDVTKDSIESRYRALSYYEGMTGEMERDLTNFFPLKSLQIPFITQNITSKLVNARAIGYKEPPVRTNEDYLEVVKDIDQAMITAERLTYLLGSHLIRSRYSEEDQMIHYDQIIEFEPLFEPRSREPFAYTYPIYNHGSSREDEVVYAYWSDEEHYLIHQNGKIESVNEGNVNPYGILPFTVCHRHPYTTDFIRSGADDIINANLMVNLLMTELGLAMRLQALGQPVISGVDQMSNVSLGVDKPMVLPENASFKFESPGGRLDEYINSIRFYVDSVAYNNNLKVKWSVGRESFVSGEALKMAEIDLTEAVVGDYQMIWRGVEQRRFEVDRRILEVHGKNVPDDYSVDFTEPRFPLTAQEERAQWDWEWSNGLSSPKDWLRKYNPDLDEEEIEKMAEDLSIEQPEQPQTTLSDILTQ